MISSLLSPTKDNAHSLPPRGRGTTNVVEGARACENIVLPPPSRTRSLSHLRCRLPPGRSLCPPKLLYNRKKQGIDLSCTHPFACGAPHQNSACLLAAKFIPSIRPRTKASLVQRIQILPCAARAGERSSPLQRYVVTVCNREIKNKNTKGLDQRF